MAEWDELYSGLGRNIRNARLRTGEFSQEKLAKRLELSRASIVNIEAGRQHAPLHLLWQIAEVLGTELALLIPRREDLVLPANSVPLDEEMAKQIEEAAQGNQETAKLLSGFVSKMKTTLESQHSPRKSNVKTRSRSQS
jgi:transcriptional regulator with XRE-family HTH domain